MQTTDIDQELTDRGLLPTGTAGAEAIRYITTAPEPTPDRFRGALLGTACGDALGRPVETWTPKRIHAQHGTLRDFVPRVGRRRTTPAGTISDDTQLTSWTAEAILQGDDHAPFFAKTLANRLRSIRGIGSGTRRAITSHQQGTPWWRSGVDSAGDGAAMRAAALGLGFGHDLQMLRRDSTHNVVVTHTNQLAVASGIAQAYAVARLTRTPPHTLDPHELLTEIVAVLDGLHHVGGIERRPSAGGQWTRLVDRITELGAMLELDPAEAFAHTHNGAYVLEALPAALWSFLSRPEDPEEAVVVAVNGGYDADTVGAMAGALAGAYHGASGLPSRWTHTVEGAAELTDLGTRLHQRTWGHATSSRPTAPATSATEADNVHVAVLLDRSGSMNAIADDVIGGFNTFLTEQSELAGECRVTLVQFDSQDPQEVVVDAKPVAEVPELTRSHYQPRGMTPLLDSLGTLVERIDRRVADHPEEFQLVAIITDGHENASHRFTRLQIAETVKTRSDDGWAFVFLGANLDSFAEAGSIGMDRAQAADWEHNAHGAQRSFDALSRSSRKIRSARYSEKQALKDRLMDEVRHEWKSEGER